MGILDSMLGGAIGAEALQLVEGAISKHGGVQGLMQQFKTGGLNGVAQSWVASGANKPITPDQVQQAMGPDTIKQLAAAHGISATQVTSLLAQHLPNAVDQLTPKGSI